MYIITLHRERKHSISTPLESLRSEFRLLIINLILEQSSNNTFHKKTVYFFFKSFLLGIVNVDLTLG